MAEQATLQLPKDLIEAAIRDNVSLAVAKALGDQSRILTDAVSRVLYQKVDSDGKPSSYSSNQTFIDWSVASSIRRAVTEMLTVELAKHQDSIKAALVAELSKKNSQLVKQLVTQMTSGICEAASNKYRLTVSFES